MTDNRDTKSAPGIVKMKCMIWEPNPISIRPSQDYGVVYNHTTLQKLPESIQSQIQSLEVAPYGIFLKQKYVYRDTFLKIGQEVLFSAQTDMLAENNMQLFSGSGVPQFPYIDHQTFILNGSLFSQNVVTPTGISQASADNLDNGLSKWTYKEQVVPFDHDGHTFDLDDTNGHDFVQAINAQTNVDNLDSLLDASSLSQNDKAFILSRKTWRFMPMQIMTSSEYKTTTNATQQNLPKGIHWLCQKMTSLYSGEDFFVEFVRLAEKADIVSGSAPMLPQYSPLDSKFNSGAATVTINGGVVELDEQGNVADGSTDTFNLNNQPYYLVEMGVGDPNHNYVILIAYNAFPILIQMGKIPSIQIGTGTPTSANTPIIPPQVIIPDQVVSRRMSTFRDVSCKDLMSQDTLRITVREHLGKFVIVFNGHEDNPWVISRTDLVVNSTSSSSSATNAPVSVSEQNFAMSIAASPIQIGAGNLKCGFIFGPLHYESVVTFKQPDYVTVNGPVKTTDINLLLGDQSTQNPALISAKKSNMRYFQDAENYLEIINGILKIRDKKDTNPIQPVKDFGKDTFAVDTNNMVNKAGEQISYISISMASPLSQFPSASSSSSGTNFTQYLKWMNVEYSIGSGDASFDAINLLAEKRSTAPWRLWNCITPVATGWRLYVAQNNVLNNQKAVDVAPCVDHFSHSWSYSDNAKLEHTGNIRFRINAGTATSLLGVNPSDTSGDQSTFLMSLSDKMFFVRIYAWWEGGYMDCKINGCPCRSPGGINSSTNPDVPRVLFTGLAFGGEITIEGQIRFMECQLFDYMRIVQDQYFLNSPFFDGMSDYHAAAKVIELSGFNFQANVAEAYPPGLLINSIMDHISASGSNPFQIPYFATGDQVICVPYVLPSSYDTLQNPFMKFSDGSKYDEALIKIGTIAGKVAYFDRFGVFRYDVRPDSLFFSSNQGLSKTARQPKCNFVSSPYALRDCSQYDLLALDTYTYKKAVSDMVNDVLLLTTTPNGELLIKSTVNFPGKYDPTSAGYIGYTKRLLQIDGIFGSAAALQRIAAYYASVMFKPPIVLSWKSQGMAHLQAMDIVTFTGLIDDKGFPPQNVDDTTLPKTTITIIITSLSSEIIPSKNEWQNTYEGEWLYGNITLGQ